MTLQATFLLSQPFFACPPNTRSRPFGKSTSATSVSLGLRLWTNGKPERRLLQALTVYTHPVRSYPTRCELQASFTHSMCSVLRSLLIKLAREIGAPQLLPSAFYDLSRYLPTQLVEGHLASDGTHYSLNHEDLCRALRGKEQAARYFSTFIVAELEGRSPSHLCVHRHEVQPSTRRACQMAFEAVTFELIRDVNGMVCNRNTDPLFSIGESLAMQTREDSPGMENKAAYRACEACRLDFGAVVGAAREEFWRQLPAWFELEVKSWA